MAVFGGAAAVLWIVLIFSSVIFSYAAVAAQLVGSWFTFKKMHKPGWKGLIPFYSTYLLFEELWETKQFWRVIIYIGIYVGLLFISMIFFIFGGVLYYNAVGVIFLIFGFLSIITAIVMIILALVKEYQLYRRMAAAFGLKSAWAWGLLFVPYIMLPIIGFNKRILYYGPVNQVRY